MQNLIDVFYDNGKLLPSKIAESRHSLTRVVGGDVLDMALTRAKPYARFVMCGGECSRWRLK